MNNKPKPPMVATLNNMGTGVVKPGEYYDKHIYVHLDQFVREACKCVEASYASVVGEISPEKFMMDLGLSVQQLAKEIKEQNEKI